MATDADRPVQVETKLEAEAAMLRFFAYEHLPAPLQEASMPFYDLARRLVLTQQRTPERTVALRKLLEAKDAAVRNAL